MIALGHRIDNLTPSVPNLSWAPRYFPLPISLTLIPHVVYSGPGAGQLLEGEEGERATCWF